MLPQSIVVIAIHGYILSTHTSQRFDRRLTGLIDLRCVTQWLTHLRYAWYLGVLWIIVQWIIKPCSLLSLHRMSNDETIQIAHVRTSQQHSVHCQRTTRWFLKTGWCLMMSKRGAKGILGWTPRFPTQVFPGIVCHVGAWQVAPLDDNQKERMKLGLVSRSRHQSSYGIRILHHIWKQSANCWR